MKCKKHIGDLSSGVGVCASCLRDRLFVLIAAQAKAQAQAQAERHDRSTALDNKEDCWKTDLQQPPPPRGGQPQPRLFPQSVSPYVGRHRKSSSTDDHAIHLPHRHRRRFFSTPQVGPTFSNNPAYESSDFAPHKKASRPSLLSFLFRTRSEKIADNLPPNSDPSSQPSPSSSVFTFWKKKQSRSSSVPSSVVSGSACRRRCTVISNRGMSPARGSDYEVDPGGDRSPSGSCYSSDDCPHSWKRTPAPSYTGTTPARKTTTTAPPHAGNLSGFVFCLSPLVRASPSGGNWKSKGRTAVEIGFPGEIGAPAKGRGRNLSSAASFCKNRSRKLADFGRAGSHR